MPMTLWDKARVGVLANLNKLLDKAVDTPDGYKQLIRDLDSATADLRAADDEVVGTINGIKRTITTLQTDSASKQSDIDLLLGDNDPSNDDAAVQLQMTIERNTAQIATLQQQQAEAEGNKAKLDTAIQQLENKHQEMVNELSKLTMAVAATNAQNRASSAAEAAASATDAIGSVDVDNLEAKLSHDKDVADARFERVIGGLQDNSSPEEAATLARAKAALEARRAQITQHAAEGAPAAEPAPAA